MAERFSDIEKPLVSNQPSLEERLKEYPELKGKIEAMLAIIENCHDEPFNVAAEMRPADWTVFDLHSIFLSAAAQKLGIELWGIVKVQQIRNTFHRPRYFKPAIREPVCLGQDRMSQDHGDGDQRRSVEGHIESQHGATGNIQRQSQPWATNRLAIVLIDQDDIRRRVVDFDNIQGQKKVRGGCMHRCKDLSRCLCAEPFRCNELGIERAQSSPHSPIVWRREALLFAGHVDELQKIGDSWTLTR